MAKIVNAKIDIRKVDKLLPNMLAVDLLDRDRYDYRLSKFRRERPSEYLQKKTQLVEVLMDFKVATDLNFVDRKRNR
jgi:hemerythrin superfamily protein